MTENLFYKVYPEQYHKDMVAQIDGVEDELIQSVYDSIKLPRRATTGSAGYDFFAPYSFRLEPGQSETIPTGICVDIKDGEFLMCVPRSGLGFKYRCQLDNTVGIIDSDYINSDNGGHIFARITNDSHDGKVMEIEAGQAFMQGIFVRYDLVGDDYVVGTRNGGFGSTD